MKLTKDGAIERTRSLFKHTSNDSTPVRDIYLAFNRDLNDEAGNAAWLSNKINPLKHFNMVMPVYSKMNGKRRLSGVELTLEGKILLGRAENVGQPRNIFEYLPGIASPSASKRWSQSQRLSPSPSPSPSPALNEPGELTVYLDEAGKPIANRYGGKKIEILDVLNVIEAFETANPEITVRVQFEKRR